MRSNRRQFLTQTCCLGFGAVAGACIAAAREAEAREGQNRGKQRVAAVQFNPTLGDVAANLEKAGRLVHEAFDDGARWVVLPEFFTSGLAMHKTMLDAHRPIDGQPKEFLRDLARAGRAYVGGSYLARSGDDVFNTFVLACPDGTTFSHDKDFPSTVFESSFYAGGEDDAYVRTLRQDGATTKAERIPSRKGNVLDGVFSLGGLDVGGAVCWELVRYRTAKRLRGKIDILLGASCWWSSDPEFGWPGRTQNQIAESRVGQKLLIENAPRRLARMLGAPVVHANFTGLNPGFSDSKFEQPVTGRFFGASQIVGARGETVAKLADEEGVVIGDVEVSRVSPVETIPDGFWMPEMTESQRQFWSVSGAAGRDFYLAESRPYFKKSR